MIPNIYVDDHNTMKTMTLKMDMSDLSIFFSNYILREGNSCVDWFVKHNTHETPPIRLGTITQSKCIY